MTCATSCGSTRSSREITGSDDEYGEWVFFLSIFGTPSTTEPWGWQLDGHHLNLHCFVLGDQVVMTPAFLGAEPCHAESGPHAGIRMFDDEERRGLAVVRSLSTEQAGAGHPLPLDHEHATCRRSGPSRSTAR